MAWLGKVTLGNFGDIAGAVTKLSESVKNIEKNFDSALGFDEKGKVNDEAQASTAERRTLLEPVFAFVGQRDSSKDPSTADILETRISLVKTEKPEPDDSVSDETITADVEKDVRSLLDEDKQVPSTTHEAPSESDIGTLSNEEKMEQLQVLDCETLPSVQQLEEGAKKTASQKTVKVSDGEGNATAAGIVDAKYKEKEVLLHENHQGGVSSDPSDAQHEAVDINQGIETCCEIAPDLATAVTVVAVPTLSIMDDTNGSVSPVQNDKETVNTEISTQTGLSSIPQVSHPVTEHDKFYVDNLKAQVKMLEDALQGAAYQSKVKADELSRLSLENDNLRSTLEDIKKKSSDAELDAMREEFQQRLNAAERKVYALTKERDMLRREQGRRDSSVLLKEKDEIIKQVMAEGEELSKKQATQEAQMRKLRAQIRELEEEKQRLKSKLQVEEATVESIRKDKAATEKALQEAVERTQVELAIQKEFYTNALNDAKEAEARAEVRADTEAKLELERRLREAGEREAALLQNLEELRQALSRAAQQAASREDMLRRDVEDLEKRCQAAELRYEELVASVPESTRPLLRQIEAMRETMAVRAEAWSGVERALNARLQEAEAKAAASQERERAINERLTQTLSRMAVLEAQVSCLKAEHAQLTRSLEKERQRASENRQEYLAAIEAAATHEGHAKQLEEDMKELQRRFKRELAEERTMRELLQQEVEQEKQKAMKHEALLGNGNWPMTDKANVSHAQAPLESSPSRSLRRFSSASSGSLEESYFLQASLDSTSDQMVGDRRSSSLGLPPYAAKGMFPNAPVEQLEALLSQKEGELALYTSRLASLESTRDALAEELVKATTQCEKLRTEVASLPGLRSEFESLRRRHTSALELMGERDEQVEELKADLADVKQMYREQIDMLVNQIEQLTISIGSR